jgi:hypothetical protein
MSLPSLRASTRLSFLSLGLRAAEMRSGVGNATREHYRASRGSGLDANCGNGGEILQRQALTRAVFNIEQREGCAETRSDNDAERYYTEKPKHGAFSVFYGWLARYCVGEFFGQILPKPVIQLVKHRVRDDQEAYRDCDKAHGPLL